MFNYYSNEFERNLGLADRYGDTPTLRESREFLTRGLDELMRKYAGTGLPLS